MNKYSWLQQKLHQFALSTQFMREATFDLENSFKNISKHNHEDNDNHIFISGLARSGTTILLNAIHKSCEFSSLTYRDMPFVLGPNFWSKLSLKKKPIKFSERAHGDGIKVSIDSPEAFEEVFWMTFNKEEDDCAEKFKSYIGLINQKYQKKRYLSKNNQNIRRLMFITKVFPNAKILITYRNPLQHANSLLNQHKRFIEICKHDKFISNYMKWIGHTEFGDHYKPIYQNDINFNNNLEINHWIEQWYLTYKNCFSSLNHKSNVHFISYEALCRSKDNWLDIMKTIGIKQIYDYPFKESKKEVSVKYDSEILDRASAIYSELSGFN